MTPNTLVCIECLTVLQPGGVRVISTICDECEQDMKDKLAQALRLRG